MRKILAVLLCMALALPAWGDTTLIGSPVEKAITGVTAPVTETFADLTGKIETSSAVTKSTDGTTWASVSGGSGITEAGVATITTTDLATLSSGKTYFRFATNVKLPEAFAAVSTNRAFDAILKDALAKWLVQSFIDAMKHLGSKEHGFPYSTYNALVENIADGVESALGATYDNSTISGLQAIVGKVPSLITAELSEMYKGILEYLKGTDIEDYTKILKTLDNLTAADFATRMTGSSSAAAPIKVIVDALAAQLKALEEATDLDTLFTADSDGVLNNVGTLLYEAVAKNTTFTSDDDLEFPSDSDVSTVTKALTALGTAGTTAWTGNDGIMKKIVALNDALKAVADAKDDLANDDGDNAETTASLQKAVTDAEAAVPDADTIIKPLKQHLLMSFLYVEMDLLGKVHGMAASENYYELTEAKPFTGTANVAAQITLSYTPAPVVKDEDTSTEDQTSDNSGSTNDNSSDTTTDTGISEATQEALDDAKANATPEEAAAIEKAEEAVKELAADPDIDMSDVSATEILTYAENIKAITEEASAETDPNSDTYGKVKETTAPAASALPLSTNADAAINKLNELSVQPKVVEVTAEIDTDQTTALAESVAEMDEDTKDDLGIPEDFSMADLVTDEAELEEQLEITKADDSLADQADTVTTLFDKIKDLLSDIPTAKSAGEKNNGVLIATVLSDVKASVSGYYPLSVNLRNLAPRRRLRFWHSTDAFANAATNAGGASLAAEGDEAAFFLDENGVPTNVVSGDASKMKVVAYLEAKTPYSPFITVDATSAEAASRDQIITDVAKEDDDNTPTDTPSGSSSSSGCDAGFGTLAFAALGLLGLRRK